MKITLSLTLMLLISVVAQAQDSTYSGLLKGGQYTKMQMGIDIVQAEFSMKDESISLYADDGAILTIHLGDTLAVSGNMIYDSAAVLFFDALFRVYRDGEAKRWDWIRYAEEKYAVLADSVRVIMEAK